MRRLLCWLIACACLGGCAPRVPYTVDTEVQPHELARVPDRAPVYCAVAEDAVVQRVAIPDTPRWFFKPFAQRPLVAYASEHGNNLIDLNTGYVIPTPGDRDPVPTPDEVFLTSPGVYLTRVEDLLNEQRRGAPLRLLADLDGEYQSPGVLRRSGPDRDYRLMIGRFKPSVRDFRVRHEAADGMSIEPLGEAWRPCPRRRLHLPMLAKDGREFGAYDVEAGSTRVFAIGGDGGCTPVDDLGMPTGKVSFSFDGRFLTFHLAVLDQASLSLAENPDDHWTSNVFVYDRRTRRIGRITHHTAGNAYYPAFRGDGRVVYLFKPLDDVLGRYSFGVADPARIRKWLPIHWYTQRCGSGDDACHRTLALGALWGYACSTADADLTPRLAALNTLSLNEARCRRLVQEQWMQRRTFIAQGALRALPDAARLQALSVDDMLRHCASGAAG